MQELLNYSHEDSKYYSNASIWQTSVVGYTHIVKELIDQNSEVNAKDRNRKTSLMHAVEGGHTEIVQSLITNGADVNAKDEQGHTPLILAARVGHTEIVKYLLAHGADIYARADKTAWMEAKENNHNDIVKIIHEHIKASIFWSPF